MLEQDDVRKLDFDTERTRQTGGNPDRLASKAIPDDYRPGENVVVPGSIEKDWVYVGTENVFASPKPDVVPGRHALVRRNVGGEEFTKSIPYDEFKKANIKT